MQPNEQGFYDLPDGRYLGDFQAYPVLFANNAVVASIAPAGQAIGTITIQSNTKFLIQQGTYFADNAAASQNDSTRLIALCNVMITDQGSSKQLTQSPVPIPSLFGTGQLPYVWQNERLCESLTVLQFIITNRDAAVTYNIQLQLIGLALFKQG